MEFIPFSVFNLTLIEGESLKLALTHLIIESTFPFVNRNGERFSTGKIGIIMTDTHPRHEGIEKG